MGLTGAYGAVDAEQAISTVRAAMDAGITLFDTADVYGPHLGEELLGRALGVRRAEVVVASKFGGAELGDDGEPLGGPNGRADYVRRSVDRALRRLGTDYIDLYYQHRVDPRVPVEETFGALGELVAQGKLRYLGICEAAPETIRRAHAAAPLSAVQTEYSLFSRQVEENGVLSVARELGIGFVASSPLGRGFLAGAVRSREDIAETDLRTGFPRFQGEAIRGNLGVLRAVEEFAEERGVTPAEASLAWVLAAGEDIVAIPGTRYRSHLDENVRAAAQDWNAGLRDALTALVPAHSVVGDRRSPADTAIEV